MHILIISWNYPPRRGGIEYLMSRLYSGLKERNSVQLITACARSPNPVEEGIFRAPLPGLIAFALYALWRGGLLLFRNPRIEIIFGGSFLVTPLVLILARLFGRRAMVQAHGLDLLHPSVLYQILCVRWGKFCDRIVANSRYTASVSREKGVLPNLISIVPPGVDAERFSSSEHCTREAQLRLEGRKTILFVGRLARRKGVKEFVQHSLTEIVREVPNALFVIAGNNPADSLTHRDDLLSEISAVISKLGLQDHVRLMGGVDDGELIRLYRACDLVILPALRARYDIEGFGIVLLEAAAAGKPTVATRVGGIPDAVEDGKSGILVEPDDYLRLSRAIIELLNNPTTRSVMGNFGQQRVREQFAWSKIIALYETVFAASLRPVP
jgi:phosphatidylinositol alpha-1,6-mannosyltransferase